MNRRLTAVVMLSAVLAVSSSAMAVDGVSVTTHWVGKNLNTHGGYGEIWRHDIVDSQVVGHVRLYFNPARPARNPVMSPDGTRVAFLLFDGAVAVMNVDGTQTVVLEGVQSHGEATLEWPSGEWIYYTQGGHNQPSGSRYLRRVHAATGIDQLVTTFLADDGITERGSWRFHVASDLRRALVRADNNPPEPYGRITALDIIGDGGRLREDRSVPRFSCAEGLDPTGEVFIAGHEDHEGVDVRRWDDLTILKSIRWSDAAAWGPDSSDTGVSHNRNAWSTNSPNWMCLHVGWGNRGDVGANQMLINWKDEERIVVTSNAESSFEFDDAGDFWVASEEPLPDRVPPTIIHTVAHADPRQVTVSFSEAVEPRSAQNPQNYEINHGVQVEAAVLSSDGFSVRLTTTLLEVGVGYEILVYGVTDLAVPPNPVEVGEHAEFSYSEREALSVDAGPDVRVFVGSDVLLGGQVSGEPVDEGGLTVRWSLLEGPGQASFEALDKPSTFARFDTVGTHVLRLLAEDSEHQASDDVVVTVEPEPAIAILSPAVGAVLVAGTTVDVQWLARSVYDMRVDLSVDGGASWELVALTIDTTSAHWGSFPFVVPDVSTERAIMQLEEYSAVTSTLSAPFSIVASDAPLGRFLSPSTGDTLAAGEATHLRFALPSTAPVDVEYSINNGASWQAIVREVGGEAVDVPWIAPRVSSQYCQVRLVNSATGALQGASPVFAIAPLAASSSSGAAHSLTVNGCPPTSAAAPFAMRAAASDLPLDGNGCYSATLPIPAGVDRAVFELQGHDGTRVFRRLVEIEVSSPS